MAKTRLNLEISGDLANFIDRLADREDTTRVEIIRRALSILKAYDQSWQNGRKHIGFTKNGDLLEKEIVGIFTSDQPLTQGAV